MSNTSIQPFPSVTILGVPIQRCTKAALLHTITGWMDEPHLHQIATANPEFVMAAQNDPDFLQLLHSAETCLADGIGLVYASRLLGQPVPERLPGSELVYDIAELAAQHGWRLFLLGAAPGVAEEAAAILQTRYPALHIAGTYAGSPASAENDSIVAHINASQADILYVAYGAPNQDKWIARNRDTLSSVRVAIGIGGSLDFMTGRSVRAPQWVQNFGLEWFHRLLHEPWRWKRMLALPKFAAKVAGQRIRS